MKIHMAKNIKAAGAKIDADFYLKNRVRELK